MNFLQKCKRSGGFTLVELIVVIAILAILAGVAVPAYTGYINKAEEAADNQLLAAVNTAFAAACLENGKDINNLGTTPTATISGGKVTAVNPHGDAFFRYYTGNESATFKVFTKLTWDNAKKSFVGGQGNAAYTELLETLLNTPGMSDNIAALKGSVFMDEDKGLGTEALLDKVDFVSNFASAMLDGEGGEGAGAAKFVEMMGGEDYMRFMANRLGIENADELEWDTESEDGNPLGEAVQNQLAVLVGEDGNPNDVLANAAVLYAAQNTKDMTAESVKALLGTDGAKSTIVANMDSNSGLGLAQAAVAYGMYTSYAYSKGDADLIASTSDPLAILKALDDDDFQTYIANASDDDVNGYLAALDMVNTSTSNTGAANDVLVNGFNSNDMQTLVNNLLASGN